MRNVVRIPVPRCFDVVIIKTFAQHATGDILPCLSHPLQMKFGGLEVGWFVPSHTVICCGDNEQQNAEEEHEGHEPTQSSAANGEFSGHRKSQRSLIGTALLDHQAIILYAKQLR